MENTMFFADLTREVTHELSNVMSVIGELSGLLGDLAAANRVGRPIDPEKLEAVAKKIDAQVERGAQIVQHFNRFAHSLDDPGGEVDLAEVLYRFSVLSKRIVARHRMTLAIDVPPDKQTMNGDAYQVYRLLFVLLRGSTADDAALTVSLKSDMTTAAIQWESNKTLPVAAEAADISARVETLGGTLRQESDAWVVTLPRKADGPKEKEKTP